MGETTKKEKSDKDYADGVNDDEYHDGDDESTIIYDDNDTRESETAPPASVYSDSTFKYWANPSHFSNSKRFSSNPTSEISEFPDIVIKQPGVAQLKIDIGAD